MSIYRFNIILDRVIDRWIGILDKPHIMFTLAATVLIVVMWARK